MASLTQLAGLRVDFELIGNVCFGGVVLWMQRERGYAKLCENGRGVACDRNFWSLVTAFFGRLWPHELLRCHFSLQAQYLVMLECHFSWQAHYLVLLEGQFFWQAQHLVKFG